LCDDIGESDASIPGYNCIRCDMNIHGAGSALFLSDKLEYQITLYGPKEQEFLLVSVFSTMLRKKCALAYGTSQVY